MHSNLPHGYIHLSAWSKCNCQLVEAIADEQRIHCQVYTQIIFIRDSFVDCHDAGFQMPLDFIPDVVAACNKEHADLKLQSCRLNAAAWLIPKVGSNGRGRWQMLHA